MRTPATASWRPGPKPLACKDPTEVGSRDSCRQCSTKHAWERGPEVPLAAAGLAPAREEFFLSTTE